MPLPSEEKTQDLRIRRTHKLLVDSLKSLLTERPFDEIHITDICERAMIHRTTFYKHFLDKYDLLSFALKDLQSNFEAQSKPLDKFPDAKEYFMSIFKNVLEYMANNRKMYLLGLKNIKNNTASQILHSSVTETIYKKLERHQSLGVVYKVPTRIIAEFYVGALFSMANWWVENDMPLSVDEMVLYADKMIVNDPFVSYIAK